MDVYEASEAAYRNGYEDGYKECLRELQEPMYVLVSIDGERDVLVQEFDTENEARWKMMEELRFWCSSVGYTPDEFEKLMKLGRYDGPVFSFSKLDAKFWATPSTTTTWKVVMVNRKHKKD